MALAVKPRTENRIGELREARGLSGRGLAQQLNMSPGTLNRLETGDMELTLTYMRRIASALNVLPSDLLLAQDAPMDRLEPDERALIEALRQVPREVRPDLVRYLINTCEGRKTG